MNSPRGAQLAPVPSLFARTRGLRWLPLVGVGGLCAIAALVACGGGNDQPPPLTNNNPPPLTNNEQPSPLIASMNVISSPAQYVSGGDTRIEIQAPTAEHANLELRLNGAVVAPKLVAGENRLEGVVAGLKNGDNVLELRHKTRGMLNSLKLTN